MVSFYNVYLDVQNGKRYLITITGCPVVTRLHADTYHRLCRHFFPIKLDIDFYKDVKPVFSSNSYFRSFPIPSSFQVGYHRSRSSIIKSILSMVKWTHVQLLTHDLLVNEKPGGTTSDFRIEFNVQLRFGHF